MPDFDFGDATDLLAAEAVWAYREDNGDWPLLEEVIPLLEELAECDEPEAERRLMDAIRDGEVNPQLRGGGRLWGVALDEETADAITRRVMDGKLKRKETTDGYTT
jgi:hypothetical protein